MKFLMHVPCLVIIILIIGRGTLDKQKSNLNYDVFGRALLSIHHHHLHSNPVSVGKWLELRGTCQDELYVSTSRGRLFKNSNRLRTELSNQTIIWRLAWRPLLNPLLWQAGGKIILFAYPVLFFHEMYYNYREET